MPIPVALNIAIRNQVRKSMVLPRPPLPLPAELFIEDTTTEQKKKLQAAGAFPSDAAAARAAAADQERAARLSVRPPAAGHIISLNSFTTVAGSSLLAAVAGPIGFPFTVDEVYVSTGSVNAAGVASVLQLTLVISNTDSILLTQIQQDRNIILDSTATQDGVNVSGLIVLGQQPSFITFRPAYDVQDTPTFVKAIITLPAGVTSPNFHITINEAIELALSGARFQAPVARTSININTAGAPRRSSSPPVPRGAILSVTQGGRIMSQRTIAWESLEPGIAREYFNEQVSGVPTPNVQWLM